MTNSWMKENIPLMNGKVGIVFQNRSHFENSREFILLFFFPELIYKEVMNFEERTKNGVVKGQPSPSGTLSA